jgi:heme-degrading monooxygenase HmoA
MIARVWRGVSAGSVNAEAYVKHFSETVLAELEHLPGQRGAWLLRRERDGAIEFIALTLWESREAIEAFTGPDIGKAVVEPRARSLLAEFDDFAMHYDVVVRGGAVHEG